MAQKNYNVTGKERKALVNKVAELTGENPVYMGMPTVSFKIGPFEISRTGVLTWEDWADDAAKKLVEDLRTAGFWAEGDAENPTSDETAMTAVSAEENATTLPEETAIPMDPPEEEGIMQEQSMNDEKPEVSDETKAEDHAMDATSEDLENTSSSETDRREKSEEEQQNIPHELTISLPDDLSDFQFSLLQQLVQGKATLLEHAFQTNSVEVIREEGKLTFPWFTFTKKGETEAYTVFLTKLIQFAKKAKRVTVKDQAVENEKYAFRCFLLRIGFVGKDYKDARHVLLENLEGNTAWKHDKK